MAYERTTTVISIDGREKEIRNARISLGLSQDRAAAYCGVAGTTFQRWEYGSTRSIRKEAYDKLEQILNGTAKIDSDVEETE